MAVTKFHPGELKAQSLAGFTLDARENSGGILPVLVSSFRRFIEAQPFVLAAALARDGRLVVRALWRDSDAEGSDAHRSVRPAGTPDAHDTPLLLTREDAITISVPLPDALARAVAQDGRLGLLVIHPATRRRMKIKGRATLGADGLWTVHVERAYGLCPKYIVSREVLPTAALQAPVPNDTSPARIREALQHADTAFFATYSDAFGPDISHRGGRPGFLVPDGDSALLLPDYAGNRMMNSIGDLELRPEAALLVPDFHGQALHLSGTAKTLWDSHVPLPGAERVIRFKWSTAETVPFLTSYIWTEGQPSPYTP